MIMPTERRLSPDDHFADPCNNSDAVDCQCCPVASKDSQVNLAASALPASAPYDVHPYQLAADVR